LKHIKFCVPYGRNISDIEEVEEVNRNMILPNHFCSLKKLVVDDSSDIMISYSENSFEIFTISVFIMILKEVFLCLCVVKTQ
jgi:hypothetical protein